MRTVESAMRSLLLFVACMLSCRLASAENPSSILQAVKVRTASGTLTGFSEYSTSDATRVNRERATKARVAVKKVAHKITPIWAEQPTPEDVRGILLEKAKDSGLWFVATAFRVSHPKDMIVTTSEERRLAGDQVFDIEPITNPLNGFVWYGVLNRVKPKDVELLNMPPLFSCQSSPADCCSIDYWLSYNQSVGAATLEPICKGEKHAIDELNVIHLEQTTD